MSIEKRVHPIPFRTRKLSASSPMILRIFTWESRPMPRLSLERLLYRSLSSFKGMFRRPIPKAPLSPPSADAPGRSSVRISPPTSEHPCVFSEHPVLAWKRPFLMHPAITTPAACFVCSCRNVLSRRRREGFSFAVLSVLLLRNGFLRRFLQKLFRGIHTSSSARKPPCRCNLSSRFLPE